MQVDLVLDGAGTYWRKRVELAAPPDRGAHVVLLDRPATLGVVVGGATPFEDDGTVAAVLLRALPGDVPDLLRAGLRREGWCPLL